MERGFKSRCEEMAKSFRARLGLETAAPLPAEMLARHLGVLVWRVSEIGLSAEDLRRLTVEDADSWSAIAVSAHGREAIMVNPTHSRARRSTDVMHELAHLILNHEPSSMYFVGEGELALRNYNRAAEEEADWLAGALLLPRDALVRLCGRRVPMEAACDAYQVSRRMMDFRMNVTGARRQFGSLAD